MLFLGKTVTVLRGAAARDFLAKANRMGFEDGQRLMARVTGNFKRGNERLAGSHPRNG